MWRLFALTLIGMMVLSSLDPPCRAQNVAGYGTMSDPFLFLMREPAVHQDLGLDEEQTARLIAMNETFDGVLLSSRNMAPDESRKRVSAVVSGTREQVSQLMSSEQQDRLRQIAFRLRGISFVLVPEVAEHLRLSESQKEQIQQIAQDSFTKLADLQSTTFEGKEAHQKTQQAATEVRADEQHQILGLLNDQQKTQLPALVGRSFDATGLGRVSFRAPELSTGDTWINSDGLQLEDLRGKVIALHFWAFG